MKAIIAVAVAVAVLLSPALLVGLLFMSLAGGATANANCITDANLAPILATIRTLESGGDYTAQAAGSSASGAYQFVDGTWNNFGGYSRAVHAPAEVQDQKAAEMARSVLDDNDGDVGAVPVVWYIGHFPEPGSSEWDIVPVPSAGNVLTPREYQAKWMTIYAEQTLDAAGGGCTYTPGEYGDPPDSLDCSTIRWGGYANGRIPESSMRYTNYSGYLHPAASAAFDDLYAGAQAGGLDLRGWGYRPAAAGGQTSGSSCHGLGLAIDITVLVPGSENRFATSEAAFASAEFTWLCANAEQYGWITPRWAIPAGMVCGTVTGTGTGGWVGNECCFLEPWHIVAAGIVATHRDFIGTDSQFAFAS